MRAKVLSSDPPVIPLKVNELLFINEYFRNGQNATQAYLTVHPRVKYGSAEVGAQRVLGRSRVQAELARRTRYEGGITKEFVQGKLLWSLERAEAKDDYVAGASIAMDCAKLAGLITEKREVKTMTDAEGTVIRDLVRRSLTTTRRGGVGHSPTSHVMSSSVPPTASSPSPTLSPVVSDVVVAFNEAEHSATATTPGMTDEN